MNFVNFILETELFPGAKNQIISGSWLSEGSSISPSEFTEFRKFTGLLAIPYFSSRRTSLVPSGAAITQPTR